jgi:hypothetical protein
MQRLFETVISAFPFTCELRYGRSDIVLAPAHVAHDRVYIMSPNSLLQRGKSRRCLTSSAGASGNHLAPIGPG